MTSRPLAAPVPVALSWEQVPHTPALSSEPGQPGGIGPTANTTQQARACGGRDGPLRSASITGLRDHTEGPALYGSLLLITACAIKHDVLTRKEAGLCLAGGRGV